VVTAASNKGCNRKSEEGGKSVDGVQGAEEEEAVVVPMSRYATQSAENKSGPSQIPFANGTVNASKVEYQQKRTRPVESSESSQRRIDVGQ
jgi:hypothetical protein